MIVDHTCTERSELGKQRRRDMKTRNDSFLARKVCAIPGGGPEQAFVTIVMILAFAQPTCWPGDVVKLQEFTEGSGIWHGYRIASHYFQATLSCNRNYGFYYLRVSMLGEDLVSIPRFRLAQGQPLREVFASFGFHEDKTEFGVSATDRLISWRLQPRPGAATDYSGSLAYTATKLALTQQWRQHADVKGKAAVAHIDLGQALLTDCAFEATLANGQTFSGSIPAKLPDRPTCLVGGKAGQPLRQIAFQTKKGKVRIRLSPDSHTPPNAASPYVYANFRRDMKPPRQDYFLEVALSTGEKDPARSYTITFEFGD